MMECQCQEEEEEQALMKFGDWRNCISFFPRYRIIKVLLYSTKTLASPPPLPSSDTLLKYVVRMNDPKASIVPLIENWINEGKPVKKDELLSVISHMRNINRPLHALEISRWMGDLGNFDLTSNDTAFRLKLIYLVHGLEHAEKYFNNISKQSRVPKTYYALLYCYVNEKSVDKAEAIWHEMKTLGLVRSSFPYNCLIDLYIQTGQQDKIENLAAEMEAKGISWDQFTLRRRLEVYVALSDIKGIRNILDLIKSRNSDDNWITYSVAAKGYLKAGLTTECLEMLKKIEALTTRNRMGPASDFLITLYASAGKKNDLIRIWKSRVKRLGNSRFSRPESYACMISALDKLGDLEGAEKILDGWVSKYNRLDFQVVNQLVYVYCKRRLFSKAEALARKALQKSPMSERLSYASTLNILGVGYLSSSDKQMASKGIEMLKEAFLVGRQGWKPSPGSVASCLEYFELERDVAGAEEFVELLGASGLLTREVYHWFLRIHIAAKKPASHVLDLMKADGLSVDEETRKILREKPDLCDLSRGSALPRDINYHSFMRDWRVAVLGASLLIPVVVLIYT